MKKYIAMAVVATMLAACSNDEYMPAIDETADTPITFQVGVTEAATRAGYEAGTLTEGTSMGFYMQTAGTENLSDDLKNKYNGVNRKVKLTKEGIGELEGSPLLWRDTTSIVTWQAYYPYTENNLKEGILTITIPDDQANDGVYDLLYAEGSVKKSKSVSSIEVKLKHTMAKFIVNITIGTELEGSEIESVVLTGMKTTVYLNLVTGSYEGDMEMPANINMIKHEDGKTFEAIIHAYTPYDFGLEITLTGGKKFYYKQGLPTFNEGMIHTLNLQVGKNKTELAKKGITVEEWEYVNSMNENLLGL